MSTEHTIQPALCWQAEADGRECPFCGQVMDFEHVRRTADNQVYCGRKSCLLAEAKRRGVNIPRTVRTRHEKRRREATYHGRGIDARAESIRTTVTPNGVYVTSFSRVK